jgi:hypothetical protein
VQYWNGTSFGSSCTAGSNDPQEITLTVNNPNGSIATTQIAVDGIGVGQSQLTVTSVNPLTASTGTPDVLLTITGTGFESGAEVTIPAAPSIVIAPMTTTFVSPTTLTVFADLTNATPGGYPITVTNPATPTYPTGQSASGGLFTVLSLGLNGMHVSAMTPNVADPVTDDPDEDATSGWDAWDTITVESGSGAPLQGAVINGTWSVAPVPAKPIGTSTTSCTTDATGTCTVYYGWEDVLHNVTATFTVSPTVSTDPAVGGLVLNGYTYTPGTNDAPGTTGPGSCLIAAPIPGNPPAPCG